MDRKYMYTMGWEPAFDVHGHYNLLPVWINFPFCALALKTSRRRLAECLGTMLVYLQGDDYSKYPNDRACILWDITKPPPSA